MSCCGGSCGCGSGCKCGTGCGGCKMYPDETAAVEASQTTGVVFATAGHKASSGGMEMAGENGGCDCTTCKCGTSCGCSCCSCT